MNEIKRPFDLLNRAVGKKVVVGVKGGTHFEGKMMAFDVHMNIALAEAKEKGSEEVFNNLFIRGDSVVYVKPLE